MRNFLSGLCAGVSIMFFMVAFTQPIPRKKVAIDKTFELDGKEWQCGYTPRQVEINLLEEKISKLKQ